MNIRTILVLAAMTASSSALLADETKNPEVVVPSVSNVRLSQAADRTVTVKYDLTNGPAIVIMDVMTNRGDGVWASIGAANITGGELRTCPQGAVNTKVEAGVDREITWRADLAWPNHKIPAGNVRVGLTTYPLDNPPDYMVVSLAEVAADRVRFYPSEDAVPGGVLANTSYRLTEILMRKIHAKGVTWTMGSFNEYKRDADYESSHQVTLDADYYIGVFEMTQSQTFCIIGTYDCFFDRDYLMRPAEQISLARIRHGSNGKADSSHDYPADPGEGSLLDSLRNLVGGQVAFDLPGEAQWEYACRSGYGEGLLNNGSLYSAATAGTFPGRHQTTPGSRGRNAPADSDPAVEGTAICGSYPPNAWGLYDMHGNVYEICLDKVKHSISDLNGAICTVGENDNYIWRSGSWYQPMENCRSATRANNGGATTSQKYLGFRLCAPARIR